MSRTEDDDRTRSPVEHAVGAPLDTLSVDELRARIARLREEITRLETAIETKQVSIGAADAVFKR